MITHEVLNKIKSLNASVEDRHQLHAQIAPLLMSLGKDKAFWNQVFKMNLSDPDFLNRKWTLYEIPFFYVYENDDFYMKVHLFTALESREINILASAIHHHNNYLLTTYAAFGSGYETFLFESNPNTNQETKAVKLKIVDRFKQKDRRLHLVNSWTPHAVVNPETFSATLVFWSPDKKRTTDKLRSNPILKALKGPLRKIIYLLGMDKSVGIAAKNTYQWYPQNNQFIGILEDDFFAPTRAADGPIVDNYSVQSIFHFMQQMGFDDFEFIRSMKSNKDVPSYYHQWIDLFLDKKPIPETFAKAEINVPNKRITIEEVVETNKQVNAL
jgi:hypothetical protein